MYELGRCLFLLLLAGSLHLAVGRSKLYSGDYCNLPSGRGVCKLWIHCRQFEREAITDLNYAKSLCTHSLNATVVCCPKVPGKDPAKPSIWTNSLKKAARKCREYSRQVFDDWKNWNDRPVCAAHVSGFKERIAGGEKVGQKEFSHMAALGYENEASNSAIWGCGGSLISDRYVLTVAHCTYDQNLGRVQYVRLGDINLSDSLDDAHVQDFNVSEIIRHPDYNVTKGKYDDIALLRLDRQVRFNAYARPACLSLKPANELPNVKATATGWGARYFWEQGLNELQKVTIPIASVLVCQTSFNYLKSSLPSGVNQFSQFCAGSKGKDTCKGDSGGPLVAISSADKCMHEVIGIASFGNMHCGKTLGLYTRVSYYLHWIENIVWPDTPH